MKYLNQTLFPILSALNRQLVFAHSCKYICIVVLKALGGFLGWFQISFKYIWYMQCFHLFDCLLYDNEKKPVKIAPTIWHGHWDTSGVMLCIGS